MKDMLIVQELPLASHGRQLHHTLVQGRDGKYYAVLTQQLYKRPPRGDFPNFETVVNETNERGRFTVLVMPYLRRFKTKEEALKNHEALLRDFDEALKLPAKKESAPAKHEKTETAH